VLPLDDRLAQRFVENAARFHGSRRRYVFHAGMGHLPTEVAPDVRSRSYRIDAHVISGELTEGVLIAHGDAASGYSLYMQGGHLVHDMNIGGEHVIARSAARVPPGEHHLSVRVRRLSDGSQQCGSSGLSLTEFTLEVDELPSGSITTQLGFVNLISWIGLDIGCDRGSPVSHYDSPFEFTGELIKVTVTMDDDQHLSGDGVGRAQLARQ